MTISPNTIYRWNTPDTFLIWCVRVPLCRVGLISYVEIVCYKRVVFAVVVSLTATFSTWMKINAAYTHAHTHSQQTNRILYSYFIFSCYVLHTFMQCNVVGALNVVTQQSRCVRFSFRCENVKTQQHLKAIALVQS